MTTARAADSLLSIQCGPAGTGNIVSHVQAVKCVVMMKTKKRKFVKPVTWYCYGFGDSYHRPIAKVHVDQLKKMANKVLKLLVYSMANYGSDEEIGYLAYEVVSKTRKGLTIEHEAVLVNKVEDLASKAVRKWAKAHIKSLKI